MSDYLAKYKKRVGLGAKSFKEYTVNEVERNFLQYLQDSPTCHEIPITDPEEVTITEKTKKVLCSINDITNNDSKAYDEKKLLVPKDANVEIGCYFFFDNCYWIITFKDHKSINSYKKFTARRCNQILNYKYQGVHYKIPVNVENLTMYSDGLGDLKYTSQQDAKRMFVFGSNPVTRSMHANTRVMLTGKTVFRITHINDFEYNSSYSGSEGIIKALVLQTTLEDKDDLVNNIAWNPQAEIPDTVETVSILGDKRIMIGSKKKYYTKDFNNNLTWRVRAKEGVVDSIVNEDGSLTLVASSNVNHTGEKVVIELLDINEDTIISSLDVELRGFI